MNILGLKRLLFACAVLAVCASGRPAAADDFLSVGSNGDPAFVTFGLGTIGNVGADRESAILFNAEYRTGPEIEFLFIRPSLGMFLTTDRTFYGYFGLSGDIFFGRRIVLTPQVAVGGYAKGDGQDLGGVLEFRSGVVLSWRFDNRSRLGIGYHHLSNAGIYDSNPGTEALTLFYSHPLNF